MNGRGFEDSCEGGLGHEGGMTEVVEIGLIILYRGYLHGLCCNELKKKMIYGKTFQILPVGTSAQS